MTKPITPQEAADATVEQIPDQILAAFNALIVKKLRLSGSTHRATVLMSDVRAYLEDEELQAQLRAGGIEPITPQEASERGWLDVEPLYRKAGWEVTYDQPGFNETGESRYLFSWRIRR